MRQSKLLESILENFNNETENHRRTPQKPKIRPEKKIYYKDLNEKSITDRAYLGVWDWIATNNMWFCKNHDGVDLTKQRVFGNISQKVSGKNYGYVDVIPLCLENAIDRIVSRPAGLSIIENWVNDDRIICGDDGKHIIQAVIARGTPKTDVIRLKRLTDRGQE